jgi:hypothetical protein
MIWEENSLKLLRQKNGEHGSFQDLMIEPYFLYYQGAA